MYTSAHNRILQENIVLKQKLAVYELEAESAVKAVIRQCDNRVRYATEKRDEYRDALSNFCDEVKVLKKENAELKREAASHKKEALRYLSMLGMLERKIKALEKQEEATNRVNNELKGEIASLNTVVEDHKKQIEALKDTVAKLTAQLEHDGTTDGIPTSQTPINKKKVIPNTREKTGRARGGQQGHEKHIMQVSSSEEITHIEEHSLDICPCCGGALVELEDYVEKNELDYEVIVKPKRHRYPKYKCMKCGKEVHAPIANNLKEANQYGPRVQATLLSLLNLGFVSVKRAHNIAVGFWHKQIQPSVGYIGKVQKKAARGLQKFAKDLKEYCLKQKMLYWDDTVVYMNTKRGCFRFYGNETFALYFAHAAKDAKGIEDDGILANLKETTTVMHDHVKYNYRKEFLFRNIECVQHLARGLEKVFQDSGHEWAKKMKELISSTVHKRKQYLKEGKQAFTDTDTNDFEIALEKCLAEGLRVNDTCKNRFFYSDERSLLNRIREYKENYFAWVYDFELPTTNNLSESSLRMTKTKMKVSGQFLKEKTAQEFALVRSYTETCKRNGINEYEALVRLMSGNPYTVAEIIAEN